MCSSSYTVYVCIKGVLVFTFNYKMHAKIPSSIVCFATVAAILDLRNLLSYQIRRIVFQKLMQPFKTLKNVT